MKWNKTLAIIAIICTCVLNVAAQERTPKTPEERATALTEWMKTNLQLTPDQEGPVSAINLKYADLNEELRGSTKTRMQKLKTIKANDQGKDKELQGVLTPEQFKTYESKKEEIKKKFKEEAQERRGQS